LCLKTAGAAVGIGQNGDHNYDNMSLELGDFTGWLLEELADVTELRNILCYFVNMYK